MLKKWSFRLRSFRRKAPRRLSLKEGTVLADRYRVETVLGKGGMGVVLKAHDLQLDEDVALKVIRPELALTPAFFEQLKQELKLARRITHRHVLRTHDFGEAEGVGPASWVMRPLGLPGWFAFDSHPPAQ